MSINPDKAEERAAARAARKANRAPANREGAEDKSIRITCGSVKRLAKELAYTHKEIAAQKTKIEKLKTDPDADQSRVPQQEAVLRESESMIPEVTSKLRGAVGQLSTLLGDADFVAKITNKKGLAEAKALLEEHSEE